MNIRCSLFLAGIPMLLWATAVLADAPASVDLQCAVTETRPSEPVQHNVKTLHIPLASGREEEGTAGYTPYSLLRVVTDDEIDLTSSSGDSLSLVHIDRASGRFDLTTYRNGETIYHAEGSCHDATKQY
jgi:hypothetical protein